MKAAIVIGALLAGVLVTHTGLGAQIVAAIAALTPAPPPPHVPAGCRAPSAEGDLVIITVTVHAGELVAECQYAGTRPPKPQRKGG